MSMAENLIISVASSVISSTINSIGTLVSGEIHFLRNVPNEVQVIQAKLRTIESYLKDAQNKPLQSHFTAEWLHQLKGVTYRAQDVIEKIAWLKWRRNQSRGYTGAFSRYFDIHKYLLSLHEIRLEIDRINKFIPEISDLRNSVGAVNLEGSSMTHQLDQQIDPDPRAAIQRSEEDEVIGFDNILADVMKDLLNPSYKPLSVISIVGMGGIGKTTLVKKIFGHSDIQNHFQIIASITVSKGYNIPNLQKQILRSSPKIKNGDLENMTDVEVRDKLCETLKEEKYLIVMDDIWETKFWDDFNPQNKTFPNMNNGSRIIVTTRIGDVARYPNVRTIVYDLPFLDDKKSWELLKKKAFPPYVLVSNETRRELENLGPPIAKQCNGMPLALVVLGGYLSKHLDHEIWSRMAKAIDWKEVGNPINISKILALSYHDLPSYLKPTFLYITTFPEDHIIESSDLIRLWIAEGFIPPDQNYKLETTARIYLNKLIERCLVQVVQRSKTHGWINKIKIHDVLRDWGIERAKKEEFFNAIKDSDQVNSYDAQTLYRVAFDGYYAEDAATSMPHLRTMLGFNLPSTNDSTRAMKSLRVFSITQKQPTNISPKYSKHTVFLRYINLRNCGRIYFPTSIGQLSNLQTLNCQETWIMSLPSSLWEILTLRHVCLEWVTCNWNGPKKGSGKNIQTLIISERMWLLTQVQQAMAWMYAGMDDVAIAVGEMKKIVKLQLLTSKRNYSLPRNTLSNISDLGNLEVLKVLNPVIGMTRIPAANIFPPNLLKLVLDCRELVESPMPILQELCKLVMLQLHDGLKLRSMHTAASGFAQLKYLELFAFIELEDWKVDVGAMPNLHHLELTHCLELKNFSEGLMQHDQLRLVNLLDVPSLRRVDFSTLENKGCKVIKSELFI